MVWDDLHKLWLFRCCVNLWKPSWLMKKPQHPQQCCTVHKGASPLPFVEIPELSISRILYSSSSSLIQCSFHTALGQKYFCHLKTKWILYLEGTWMQTFSGGSTSGMKKARRRRVSCTASMLWHRNLYFLKYLFSYLWWNIEGFPTMEKIWARHLLQIFEKSQNTCWYKLSWKEIIVVYYHVQFLEETQMKCFHFIVLLPQLAFLKLDSVVALLSEIFAIKH